GAQCSALSGGLRTIGLRLRLVRSSCTGPCFSAVDRPILAPPKSSGGGAYRSGWSSAGCPGSRSPPRAAARSWGSSWGSSPDGFTRTVEPDARGGPVSGNQGGGCFYYSAGRDRGPGPYGRAPTPPPLLPERRSLNRQDAATNFRHDLRVTDLVILSRRCTSSSPATNSCPRRDTADPSAWSWHSCAGWRRSGTASLCWRCQAREWRR